MTRLGAILVDLSGTLHLEDQVIPGAVAALKRLRNRQSPVRFLTNTTKESIRVLHNRLVHCGFDISKNEMFTSLLAARKFVEEKQLRPLLLLEPEALEDFQGLSTANPNAVVVGLAPSEFHFERLNEAFKLVLKGAELVAIHKGKYFATKDGLSLGPGPFVEGIEYATGKKSTVVGKPSATFFQMALQSLEQKVAADNCVMIGDDVTDDVIGAIDAGMKGILVQTGKYRQGDELKIPQERRNCVGSFVEAVDLIENNLVK